MLLDRNRTASPDKRRRSLLRRVEAEKRLTVQSRLEEEGRRQGASGTQPADCCSKRGFSWKPAKVEAVTRVMRSHRTGLAARLKASQSLLAI